MGKYERADSNPAGYRRSTWVFWLATALALSIGWGIRGNFGHEFGAMLPGALAAMAGVLMLPRPDWHRRVHFAGFLGALGWSFGGSISYMIVIAYTHSGHAPSVLYGFLNLTLIGFLWAALGGAGTAMALTLDRAALESVVRVAVVVICAWIVQELFLEPALRQAGFDLNWYDTDWLGTLVALGSVLIYVGLRRRLDQASALALYMCIGWYVVFLGLVVALGVRMTPPRGDNWAGCTGLFLGLLVWCRRYQQPQVAWAAIVAGTVGGIAFAGATMAKLVEVTSGLETNWHSILEQTIGFVNGIGIALVLRGLSRKQAPPPGDDGKRTRWVDLFAVFFVTIGITYLNLRKNPALWIRFTAASSEASVFPSFLHGIPSERWFDLAYCLISLAVMVPLILNAKRPIAAIPPSWVGRGQLLLLLLLWWMVVGNFERALLGFHEQRLVTEGVILVNAVALTLLLLLGSPRDRPLEPIPAESGTYALGKAIVVGVVAMTIGVLLDLAIVRAIHGDRFAGHAGYHNRFDPTAKAP